MNKFPNYFTIKDGRLFNTNTKRFEGCPGDEVELPVYFDGERRIERATLSDFTNYQIIPTKEYGIVMIDVNEIDELKFIK